MNSEAITYERRESFAVITLNRPEKLNALSADMLQALVAEFSRAQNEPDLRAIILTGSGRAFCAGTDIGELSQATDAKLVSERGQAACNQIENCELPVIAAINGIAAGGGAELALACHLRIASSDAQFNLPEIKLGLIPGYGGTQRLIREIGRSRALEAMLTGKPINSEEALRLGLVNRVVPTQLLINEAEQMAREIAHLAPLAIRACLKAVTAGSELPLTEGLALESALFAQLFSTEDMREGTRAFLEKRKPMFKGK